MLVIKEDCLVLDRGIDKAPSDRFICIKKADGLVNNDGFKTKLGKKFTTNAMVNEAKKAGAEIISDKGCVVGGDTKEYLNDAILAFNGGDTVFENDEIGIFLKSNGLAVKKQ